ncbi:MAG TPA: sodium:solute symporter [Micropepsaceae bacterium]
MPLNVTALIVFVFFFTLVTFVGFAAARWKRGDLDQLHEWGLAGGKFGTLITWFLLGGDLYTAYTFIAVPALAFGAGALAFFAVPYTIVIYPFVFVVFPRLWSVARARGYITAADFIRGRYGDRWLALAIALTGILATLPYIALQLIGLEVVIAAMGVQLAGFLVYLPLILSFAILAAFDYFSGLRAPAAIAIIKDIMIYITVFAAVIVIPLEVGGWSKVFAAVPPEKLLLPDNLGSYTGYATLFLGSAMALFLYPHSVTGVLSSSSRHVIRRNAALLPAYSFLLGLIALLGFMALAVGVREMPAYANAFKQFGPNFAVPALFLQVFPSWFVGFAFASIGIGALVPAAIMSIASANLFSRNIYREFINPNCNPMQESRVAKTMSLVAKVGALMFIIFLPHEYAIQMQLLGGIWIIHTFPAMIFGLYTRWLNSKALLIGWAVGMIVGTWMAAANKFGAIYEFQMFGIAIRAYIAITSVLLNFGVSVVLTLVFNMRTGSQRDETVPSDYYALEGIGGGGH